MKKEKIQHIEKVWGVEIWIVNRPEYCAKFLCVDKGARCSYHSHPKKMETFFGVWGQLRLTIEGKDYDLQQNASPKTIMPGEKHSFYAYDNSIILEVSTYHDDNDVERFSESEPGEIEEERPWIGF